MKNNKSSKEDVLIKILVIILILIIGVGVYIFLTQNNILNFNDNEQAELKTNEIVEQSSNEVKEETIVEDISFNISAIGDVMCHNTQYRDAYIKETGKYDFSYVFDEIKQYTQSADLTIGSLETVFAGSDIGYSNYPMFNSPDALAYDLSEMGVDILSTAGNHVLDKGISGLNRTIDVLNDAGISNTGTYKSQKERDTTLIKDVKGVKIGIINYTYGTNGIPIPKGKEYCVNLIDKDLILGDIENAKKQGVDMIIACMHWGTEYSRTANDEQIELSNFLFENGVNIILGNHPHVLEPMEKRTVTLKDGSKQDGFIIYASGNFICDQNYKYTRNSAILDMKITKKANGKINIDKVSYVPIYMYKDNATAVQRMKLMDIEQNIYDYENGANNISNVTYNLLKTELKNITDILGKEIQE